MFHHLFHYDQIWVISFQAPGIDFIAEFHTPLPSTPSPWQLLLLYVPKTTVPSCRVLLQGFCPISRPLSDLVTYCHKANRLRMGLCMPLCQPLYTFGKSAIICSLQDVNSALFHVNGKQESEYQTLNIVHSCLEMGCLKVQVETFRVFYL